MTKKANILCLYKQNLSVSEIAIITQTSDSYIYKVLSEYRNQYQLPIPSKKSQTKRKVLSLLSMGFSVEAIKEKLGITVKYINILKRGY